MSTLFGRQLWLWVVLLCSGPLAAVELTLAEALQRTVQHSPKLQTYPYQLRQDAALQQLALLKPDPELELSAENLLGTNELSGVKGAEISLVFSQLLERGDKAQLRSNQAIQQNQLTQAAFAADKLDVLAQSTGRFIEVLSLQQQLGWLAQRFELEQKALLTAQQRAAQALVQQADVKRLERRLLQTGLDQARLQGELELARRQLALLWNAEPDFDWLSGNLSLLPLLPEEAQLQQRLLQSPQLALFLTKQRLADSLLQLQSANAVADLRWSAGVRYNNEVNSPSLQLGLSMPLLNSQRSSAQLEAASAAAQQAAVAAELEQRQLQLSLLGLLRQLHSIRAEIRATEQQLLPSARVVLSATQQGYQSGVYDMTDLLAAQQELLDSELSLLQLQRRFHLQLTELQRLTGFGLAQTGPVAFSASAEVSVVAPLASVRARELSDEK
ncbi:TolC family protein [Rheinheimera sp.]|uniref:TolC family protein n=1 Tax=Rheinheimera sp. TaxID=1869214 RepID=UPI00307EBF2C